MSVPRMMGCGCRHDAECTCPLADDAEERAAQILGPSDQGCTRPPFGWYCSRPGGHEGPCAAWPEYAPASPAPVEEREAARETRIVEQARTVFAHHRQRAGCNSVAEWKFARALLLAHGELAARRAGEYAIRTDFSRAAGDALCSKCGLEYRDHYEHPAETWLHVLCDGRKVKL